MLSLKIKFQVNMDNVRYNVNIIKFIISYIMSCNIKMTKRKLYCNLS